MKAFDSINLEGSPEFETIKYICKTNFDMKRIKEEERHYINLPKKYAFKDQREKEIMLNRNFCRINKEMDLLIEDLIGDKSQWSK